MQTLKEAMAEVLKDLRSREVNDQAKIFKAFEKKLGKQERRHIKCTSFSRGVLTVNVDSSAWLYQLNQRKEELMNHLGISNIKLRIADIMTNEKEKRGKKEKRNNKKI
jgi:hypothetical protein